MTPHSPFDFNAPRPFLAPQERGGSSSTAKTAKKEGKQRDLQAIIAATLESPTLQKHKNLLKDAGLEEVGEQLTQRVVLLLLNNFRRLLRTLPRWLDLEKGKGAPTPSPVAALYLTAPHLKKVYLERLSLENDRLKALPTPVTSETFLKPSLTTPLLQPLWENAEETLRVLRQKAEERELQGRKLAEYVLGPMSRTSRLAEGDDRQTKQDLPVMRALAINLAQYLQRLAQPSEVPSEESNLTPQELLQAFSRILQELREYLQQLPEVKEKAAGALLDAELAEAVEQITDFSNPFLYHLDLTPYSGEKQEVLAVIYWRPPSYSEEISQSEKAFQLGEFFALVPRLSVVSDEASSERYEGWLLYHISFEKVGGMVESKTISRGIVKTTSSSEALNPLSHLETALKGYKGRPFNPTPKDKVIENALREFRFPAVADQVFAYPKELAEVLTAKSKFVNQLKDLEFALRVWLEGSKESIRALLQERYEDALPAGMSEQQRAVLWNILADAFVAARAEVLKQPQLQNTLTRFIESLTSQKR